MATDDIPEFSIQKGELGGWVCKETSLTGVCWIDSSSFIINSTLHSTHVAVRSKVSHSTISNSLIRSSKIKDTTATYLVLSFSEVDKSMMNSALSATETPLGITLFQISYAELMNCHLNCTSEKPKDEPSFQFREVRLENSNVEGKEIRIYNCDRKLPLRNLKVSGKDIHLESLHYVKDVVVQGKHIFITNIKHLSNTELHCQHLTWHAGVGTSVEFCHITCTDGVIKGVMKWNRARFTCMKMSVGRENDEITLVNSTFYKDIEMEGVHSIEKTAFSKGLLLSGQSRIKGVLSTIAQPSLSGDIVVEYANLKGENIAISDYAQVLGYPGERIVLKANVHVSELAVISNQDSGTPLELKEILVNGDTRITS